MAEHQEKCYPFEASAAQSTSRRSDEDAESARDVLLSRLEIGGAKLGPALERLVLKYCIEVPLNIAWYENARRKAQMLMRFQRFVVAVIMLGGLFAVAWFTIVQTDKQLIAAQLGAILATLLFALQVLVFATDKKAQFGGFWKASADLKEALYTFQQTWAGRVMEGETISAAFGPALWQEIQNARRVARTERDAYFNTFKSAAELLTLASAGFDAVRSRGQQIVAIEKEAAASAEGTRASAQKQLADLRQKLLESNATVVASLAKEAELRKTPGMPAEDLLAVSRAVIGARSDVVRYTEMINVLVRADGQIM